MPIVVAKMAAKMFLPPGFMSLLLLGSPLEDVGVGRADAAGFGADGAGDVLDRAGFVLFRSDSLRSLENAVCFLGAAGEQEEVAFADKLIVVRRLNCFGGCLERLGVRRNAWKNERTKGDVDDSRKKYLPYSRSVKNHLRPL
jgi:hypothetical protein